MRKISGKQIGSILGIGLVVVLFIALAWVVIGRVPAKETVVEKEVVKEIVVEKATATSSPTVYSFKATETPEPTQTPTATPTPVGAERFVELVAEAKRLYEDYLENGDIKTLNNAKRKFIEAYKIAKWNPQLLDGSSETYSLYKEVVLILIDVLSDVGKEALQQGATPLDLPEEFEFLTQFGESQLEQTLIENNKLALEQYRVMRSYFDQIENPPKEGATSTPTVELTLTPTVQQVNPTPTAQIAGTPIVEAENYPRVCYVYRSGGQSRCKAQAGDTIVVVHATRLLENSQYCTCFLNPNSVLDVQK